MEITTEQRGDVSVVRLDGELDASNFEEVIETARTVRDSGARALVFDMSGLTYMGSAGLVAIHSAAILMSGGEPPSPEDGWDALHQLSYDVSAGRMREAVKLAAPPPTVDRVLERAGLKRLFEIHPDVESAVAAARPTPA